MKRFLLWLLLVNALIAGFVALIGWTMGWNASDYTLGLLVACGLAFFATSATLGTSGPMGNIAATGPGPFEAAARGEAVAGAMEAPPGAPKGDFLRVWKSRQGEKLGPRPFFIMLVTCITTGGAAIVSWKVFE